ncbi:MAG: nucleotidyltransferase domain-containing protein [Nitrospirota bacterium]|nr:nucleotidyltransferase domain-containing protein [Nitrospirota bacterium]
MTHETPDQLQTILKVLVGSQAHGLATKESDRDFRRVYVMPTQHMFQLGFKYQATQWTKAEGDETAWEVGQFLMLASQCHPLALETLLAPIVTADEWGQHLRTLFPAIWSPTQAFEAFTNYARNQRTKFLDKKDDRPAKYAVAYIRVLDNLRELLETGAFTVQISSTALGATLLQIQSGEMGIGHVIDLGEDLLQHCQQRLRHCTHAPDHKLVQDFLTTIRKAFLV